MAEGSELEAQMLDVPRYKINTDAYNQKRKTQLANEVQKLLSLAIALRSELQLSPGARPSRDAVRKVQEIEKLAHAVKNDMRFSPPPAY